MGGKKARGEFENSVEELNLNVKIVRRASWEMVESVGKEANVCWGGSISTRLGHMVLGGCVKKDARYS